MRASLLLLVACAAAAVVQAAPSPDDGRHRHVYHTQPLSRVRRFLFGWDLDGYLHSVWASVHRALAASRRWLNNGVVWLFRRPHVARESVYHLDLPGGSHGVVSVIEFDSSRGGRRQDLAWDGHRLVWQHAHHSKNGHAVEDRIRLTHRGRSYVVPLDVLAKHLKQVAAGSRISAELLGREWKDLRLVLHVKGKHGKEDAQKSVSVLVWKLVEEAQRLQGNGHHDKHQKEHQDHHKNQKKQEKHEDHQKHQNKNQDSHQGKNQDKNQKGASGNTHKKSNSLVWNGQGLAWDKSKSGDNSKAPHRKRQLRITQDGVSHVIPLSILAKHVGEIPAGSKMDLTIKGKTLGKIRIVLVIHATDGKTKTITLPVAELIKEADASGDKGFHGGKVVAQVVKQVKKHPAAKQPAVRQV